MSDDALPEILEVPEVTENSMGIPEAEFVQDVDEYMNKSGETYSVVITKWNEIYTKYKFMERNLNIKRLKLRHQIPEIEKNLEILKKLKEKHEKNEEMDVNYQLDYHVYQRAYVPPTDKVGLWLGANVMLEYSIEEAEELLNKNLSNAHQQLKTVELDSEFLKNQITTTEVNVARIFNWNVQKESSKLNPK